MDAERFLAGPLDVGAGRRKPLPQEVVSGFADLVADAAQLIDDVQQREYRANALRILARRRHVVLDDDWAAP